MQDQEPTPSLPPREQKRGTSTLLVAFVSVTGVIAILMMVELGMSTIGSERNDPFMTFTPEDTHLSFHYFSNAKRRTIKTVNSVHEVPREHRRMIIVTERDERPLQSETVYVANLTEQFPSGNIRAHRLEVGQVLFAIDMQAQAHREAVANQRQLPATNPMGAGQIDSYRQEMNQIDTTKLKEAELPINIPDPDRLQDCSKYQGQREKMTRCMNAR